MVRFSADLITGTELVVHCREHYLWLSLENWLKWSAESIDIKILITEIRVNQMTWCGSHFQCSLLPNNFGLNITICLAYVTLLSGIASAKPRCLYWDDFNRIMMQTMPPFAQWLWPLFFTANVAGFCNRLPFHQNSVLLSRNTYRCRRNNWGLSLEAPAYKLCWFVDQNFHTGVSTEFTAYIQVPLLRCCFHFPVVLLSGIFWIISNRMEN